MTPEQLAELRRASHVSQQMAYQRAAADQMQQHNQQLAYQHAAAMHTKRASLQAQNPMAYPQEDADADLLALQARPNNRGRRPNQHRNTTFY